MSQATYVDLYLGAMQVTLPQPPVCLPGMPTRSDPHRRGLGSDSRRCLSLAPGHLPDSQNEGRCVFSINYIACTASLGTRIYSQLLGTEVSRKNSFTEQG